VNKKNYYRGGLALVLLVILPHPALAQAWLPPKGSFSYGLIYNDTLNKQHYLPSGDTTDVGHTRSYITTLSLGYAPADRWLVTASVPFVRARYYGPRPHPGSVVDDGRFHSTITDLRVELHYQWFESPVAFSPYVGVVIPLHPYPTFGHASLGRRLHEQLFGFYSAMSLDEWIPRTYLQVKYSYAFVEKRADISHDRSNADLELGYFPDPRWSIRAIAYWQWTHGGIDVPVPPTSPFFPVHDQIAAERYFQLGGGAAISVTRQLNAYALYRRSLSGANGHRVNDGLTLGFTYSILPTAP
jgi:hypothetical protein